MNGKRFWIGIAALLLVIGVAYFFASGPDKKDMNTPAGEESVSAETQSSGVVVEIDEKAVTSERILGNPEAPIRISEHSSFTCGHCGHFHKDTYPELKEKYIDTGQAYLVFSDFPLNAPALHASMIARCVPQDRYFDFVQHLYEQQEHWAYESTYLSLLKDMSAEYGLDADTFKACLQNENIQKTILERMKAAQTQWDISSTPTLVINNKTVIAGALPYEELDKQIQTAVTGKAPAAEDTSNDAGMEGLEQRLQEQTSVIEEQIQDIQRATEETTEEVADDAAQAIAPEDAANDTPTIMDEIKDMSEEAETTLQETAEDAAQTVDETAESAGEALEAVIDETAETVEEMPTEELQGEAMETQAIDEVPAVPPSNQP